MACPCWLPLVGRKYSIIYEKGGMTIQFRLFVFWQWQCFGWTSDFHRSIVYKKNENLHWWGKLHTNKFSKNPGLGHREWLPTWYSFIMEFIKCAYPTEFICMWPVLDFNSCVSFQVIFLTILHTATVYNNLSTCVSLCSYNKYIKIIIIRRKYCKRLDNLILLVLSCMLM